MATPIKFKRSFFCRQLVALRFFAATSVIKCVTTSLLSFPFQPRREHFKNDDYYYYY